MIAKKHRVDRTQISYILRKGDSQSSRLFLIRSKKNTEQFSRYRVIISKKVAKEAVARNLLRRRTYESIRLNIPTLKSSIQEHFDLILIAKKYLSTSTFKAIESDIKNIILTLPPHQNA